MDKRYLEYPLSRTFYLVRSAFSLTSLTNPFSISNSAISNCHYVQQFSRSFKSSLGCFPSAVSYIRMRFSNESRNIRLWEKHQALRETSGFERNIRLWEKHHALREASGFERNVRLWEKGPQTMTSVKKMPYPVVKPSSIKITNALNTLQNLCLFHEVGNDMLELLQTQIIACAWRS